jgi:hypothetical protein
MAYNRALVRAFTTLRFVNGSKGLIPEIPKLNLKVGFPDSSCSQT